VAEETKRVRAKHNVLLGVILVVLVGYYALFEVSSPPQETKVVRGTPIYLVEPWDVKRIAVAGEDEKQVVAEREEKRWLLIKGKPESGFETKVDDFVTALLMTVEIDKFPYEENLRSDCGLDNPSYTVTLTDITDKTYTLFVGGKTPVGTCIYARFADSPNILVVGALLGYELSKLDSLME